MSALVANFSNLATLYKSARAGVDDAVDAGAKVPEVLIHIDDGWDITLQQRWFGALVANDVKTTDWTTFGFSFYPFYGTSATFANLKNSLHTLTEQYRKPEIPYSIQGQTTWVDDVIEIVKEVLGRGVHYWEPLNNTSLGSDCNDAILFTADCSAYPKTVGYKEFSGYVS